MTTEKQIELAVSHDNKLLKESVDIINGESNLIASRDHLVAMTEFYSGMYAFLCIHVDIIDNGLNITNSNNHTHADLANASIKETRDIISVMEKILEK